MAQVQGEEIYLAHSGQEVDDNIDEVVAARGSEASLSARLADIVGDFEADQQRQKTEIGVVAAMGAKNLFNIDAQGTIDYRTTHTISGDTVTITGSAGFSRFVVPVSLKAGSYIFTANVNSISTSGRFRFNTASDGTGSNVASQIDFSQAGSVSRELTINQDMTFYVMIYSSTSSTDTSSSLVMSQCMIRRAEITDATYMPYAPTNRELYEMILALQSGRSLQSSPASLMQAGRIDAELTDVGTDETEEEER